MSAMFDDYEGFLRALRKAPPLTEERAQLLAEELVTGLRGEEREVMLGVLIELAYGMMPAPEEGASRQERSRWERHLGVVDAIARLAESGGAVEQQAKRDLCNRRKERTAASRRADDPLPSPAPKEQDDEPTLAEITGPRYSQSDYERWLAPIVHDLAHPEVPAWVDRADQLMRLLWVLEGAGRADRDTAFEVAMSHAYNFTTHGRQQQVAYLARVVSRSGAGEEEPQPVEGEREQQSQGQGETGREYTRLKRQEQIVAKVLMDSTPDEVIEATLSGLLAKLEGQTPPGQAAPGR
ncbi:MAG TPA: hypothetical protein VE262_21895 [Blastocatellia bacterium]|nr:hypothetical protein [Blastocatellia bacterium]